MVELKAAQYVFGNFTPERSSITHIDGHTIRGYSLEVIDSSRAEEIRGIVADRGNLPEGCLRRSYFRLRDGALVFAQSLGLPPLSTGSDMRAGVYVVHAFVLSEADFRAVGNDPFCIFDSAPFALDGAMVLTHIEHNGNIQPVTLSVEAPSSLAASPKAPEWQNQQLFDWVGQAYFRYLARDKPVVGPDAPPFYVLVSPDARAIEDILRWTLAVVPIDWRLYLSFNTTADGCTTPNLFWASRRSSESSPTYGNEHSVNADTGAVRACPKSPLGQTAYGRWLWESLKADDRKLPQSQAAWYLDRLLAGSPTKDAPVVPQEFAQRFIGTNIEHFQNRLDKWILAAFDKHPELMKPVTKALIAPQRDDPLGVLRMLSQPADYSRVSRALFDYYTQLEAMPPDADVRVGFGALATEKADSRLQALCAVWSDRLQEVLRYASRLSDGERTRLENYIRNSGATRALALALPPGGFQPLSEPEEPPPRPGPEPGHQRALRVVGAVLRAAGRLLLSAAEALQPDDRSH